MNRFVLVLTACVDPSTAPRVGVVLSDPQVRLQQYKNALRYWLHLDDPRFNSILFIENSGSSLSSLIQLVETDNPHSKEVEFLQLNSNHFPEHLDYGYAELAMVDEAVKRSRLIATSSHFIKVTGRLTFPALPRLLDRLPDQLLFAVDGRQSFLVPRSPYIHSLLMIFSVSFYQEHLTDLKARLNDVVPNMETLLYFKLIGFNAWPGVVYRFPINVNPIGNGAFDGRSYNGLRRDVASAVRSIARRVAPNKWI